jgi:NarL family two-component system response regulator YdfI
VTRVAVVAESVRQRRELADIVRSAPGLHLAVNVPSLEDLDAASLGMADEPDVLLIECPHAAAQVLEDFRTGTVVLSDDFELHGVPRAARAGLALLPLQASAEQIVAAIGAVAQGLFVLHADLTRPFLYAGHSALTPREGEVLQMLAAGLGNKAIGSRLGISEHTAKFHVAQILSKLDAASRAEAVSIAMRRGLVPL